MIIFAKSITGVFTHTEFNGYADYIHAIEWQLLGTAPDGRFAYVRNVMPTVFPEPEQPYTPRNQATEELLLAWVEVGVTEEEMRAAREWIEAELATP